MKQQLHDMNGSKGAAVSAASAAAVTVTAAVAAGRMGGTAGGRNSRTPWLDDLPQSMQFVVLALGVFLFFGLHNLLQEAIMSVPEFNYGVMLGWAEVFGVATCSYIEREYIAKERDRVAPLSSYPLLTALLMASSSLSNMSLNYINFPTKVVFRSCKLVPTMIVASLVHRKVFSSVEYLCALSICLGLVLFGAADWELTPSFHPIGLILVTLSVCADAILPNAQERLFGFGASRLEVTLYTNIFTLIVMTLMTGVSGDLIGALRLTLANRQLAAYFGIYTFVAYVAISVHMTVVKRFGGVAAVLVATARKGMTLVLSFVIFPKAFSWFYPAGAVLVLGGLLTSSLIKIRKNNNQAEVDRSRRIASTEQQRKRLLSKAHDSDAGGDSSPEASDVEMSPPSSTYRRTTSPPR